MAEATASRFSCTSWGEMVAHAQVIETSEEEAYIAVAKFIAELLVRAGARRGRPAADPCRPLPT